jgi:hypothetical protein
MYRSGEYYQLISQLSPSLPYKPSFPAIRRLRSIYATILTKRWSSDIDDSDIHPAPSSDIPGPCPGRGSLNRKILSLNPSNVRLSTMPFKDEGKFLEGTPTEMALC